ncbi:hypothetical protein AB6H97_000949 [Providencia rettgeri]
MYNTGTVTTTANSTKLVGTNTKWLNNINRVSAEQAIQIQIGTTVHNNSIQSIQSDTELTLNFPIPTAATGAKYVILTTMVHSVSDAMNKIVSMNVSNVQFSDILTRWMTEQGIITVTLPDQTTQQLRTTKEMDKQLDGKFDKAGGQITRDGAAISLRAVNKDFGNYVQYLNSDGTRRGFSGFGSNTSKAFSIVNDEVSSNLTISERGLTFNGTKLMLVGDYGWAGSGSYRGGNGDADFINITKEKITQVFRTSSATTYQYPYGPTFLMSAGDAWASICIQHSSGNVIVGAGIAGQAGKKNTLYGTANTTKDSNGNLKAASPIIKVFADHIDPNEEADGVTLKKLHTGIYQLHGTLGLHSDASWGGINGGITIPCGINQLPLVYALYDVLEKGKPHPFDGRIVEPDEDGDIVLYTSYRQHDLPQNIQYERFKLYPEFLRDATEDEESIPGFDGKVELTPGEPCDIPVGHWVDVRVNMPSNSIYNQKQAEADRLAKIEAERLAQEEAKRAAEEAERAEQEAAEQAEEQ